MSQSKIYSARLTAAQHAACQSMEAVSGLPPIGLENLNAGNLTPKEFWRLNLVTAHDIYTTIQNIDFPTYD